MKAIKLAASEALKIVEKAATKRPLTEPELQFVKKLLESVRDAPEAHVALGQAGRGLVPRGTRW